MLAGYPALRVYRVSVTAEAGDHQAALLDGPQETALRRGVFQQRRRVTVGIPWVTADTYLDRLASSLRDMVEHLLERHLREQDCEHSDFHRHLPRA